jgi:hypothetical protein
MADETFIENAIYGFAIVDSAVRFTNHAGARGRHLSFRHGENELRASAKDERTDSVASGIE